MQNFNTKTVSIKNYYSYCYYYYLGWMDGVKVAIGNRGMTVEAARQCVKDRKAWRALVHM